MVCGLFQWFITEEHRSVRKGKSHDYHKTIGYVRLLPCRWHRRNSAVAAPRGVNSFQCEPCDNITIILSRCKYRERKQKKKEQRTKDIYTIPEAQMSATTTPENPLHNKNIKALKKNSLSTGENDCGHRIRWTALSLPTTKSKSIRFLLPPIPRANSNVTLLFLRRNTANTTRGGS